jgi:hypothetical protein
MNIIKYDQAHQGGAEALKRYAFDIALILAIALISGPAAAQVNGVAINSSKGVQLLGSPTGAANCKAATTGAIRYNSTTPGHRILQRHGMEGACSGAKRSGRTRRKGYFVMSYSTYNGGAFGNLTGADAACLTDITTHTGWMGYSTANSNGQLVGSKVRAFLCSGVVCNNLIPLTTYYFADAANSGAGGAYFTTDSNGFGPNNSNSWSAANYFSGSYFYWTNRSYTSASLWNSTPVDGNSCFNWSGAYGDRNAEVGVSGATNAGRWSSFLDTCDKSYRVICVVNP